MRSCSASFFRNAKPGSRSCSYTLSNTSNCSGVVLCLFLGFFVESACLLLLEGEEEREEEREEGKEEERDTESESGSVSQSEKEE